MDGRFVAFTFVDRITSGEPGVRIRGLYAVPAQLASFPASLVAEATGQLAAWSAMAAVGFTHRPVAGIAGRIELLEAVRPGQVLELAADLESVDTEMVSYAGTAHADGIPAIRLHECVGPMMPAEEFDDPRALRDQFDLLCGAGTRGAGFPGLPALDLEPCGGESGLSARATLRVPATAPLFADHFPRRPVFPGTLLMHANLRAAALLAEGTPCGGGAAWVPRVVSDVKLRTFIPPGETLQLEAKRTAHVASSLRVSVESRSGQRLIGSAVIEFLPEAPA